MYSKIISSMNNAITRGNAFVQLKNTKISRRFLERLATQGHLLIEEYKQDQILVTLNWNLDRPPYKLIQVSKPSRRVYAKYKELCQLENDHPIRQYFIETNKGLFLGFEEIHQYQIGGEIICYMDTNPLGRM